MSEIVKGLFGISPQELTMRRNQEDEAAALGYARLTPMERADYGISRGAGQLARGVVGMLGATDPEMKKASDLDSILKTSDPTNVVGLRAMAKKAADMGYGNEAMQAAAAADKMEQDQADLGFKRSQTTKNLQVPDTATPEMKNAAAVASSVAKPGTPEWDKAYTAKLDELASKEGTVQKVGLAKGTEQAVYRDKNGQFIYGKDTEGKQVRVPYSGGIDQITSRTTVDARNIGENAFVKELGQIDAKLVNGAIETRTAAIAQLNTLQKMVDIESRPLISGSLAEQRTDVSNFLNTLGLSSNADRMKTANSQEYIKYSTGLVLDNLKKTGYNPSNVDMKVVQATIARLETDPMARRELTQFMIEAANKSIKEADSLEKYARINKGLSGYRPLVPEVSFKAAAPASAYSGMSNEELAARIEAARKPK